MRSQGRALFIDRSWPGRAEAALKFGAGKLTFAGVPRPSFRARREGLLMAGKVSSRRSPAAVLRLDCQIAQCQLSASVANG